MPGTGREDARQIYNVILHLLSLPAEVRHSAKITDAVLGTGAGRQQAEQPTPSDERNAIEERLKIIDQRYVSIERQKKAERLSEAVNLRSEAVDLVCDLRPIFDETKDSILGVVPFTTMKIVASGVDQFPVNFEVVLSASQVIDLQVKVDNAIKKLNRLGELAATNSLTIPDVDLTQTK